MDSDDEEALAALLEEEAEADVQEVKHLMVLAALEACWRAMKSRGEVARRRGG